MIIKKIDEKIITTTEQIEVAKEINKDELIERRDYWQGQLNELQVKIDEINILLQAFDNFQTECPGAIIDTAISMDVIKVEQEEHENGLVDGSIKP